MNKKLPNGLVLCLNPGCAKAASHRGLCKSCYSIAMRLVKAGKITTEQLMAEKKLLPIRAKKGPTEWFLAKRKTTTKRKLALPLPLPTPPHTLPDQIYESNPTLKDALERGPRLDG